MKKKFRSVTRLPLLVLAATVLMLCTFISFAQSDEPLPETLDLPLLSSESVPATGTFYLLSSYGANDFGPPWPFNPLAEQQLDVFWLGTNYLPGVAPWSFIVDDTAFDYVALQSQMSMSMEAPPAPGEGATNNVGGIEYTAYDYATNSFWIEILSATGSVANLVLHGTIEDTTYEILSKESLTNTSWISEGLVLGAVGQDWTPTTIRIGDRTNNLFLWARTWADDDGDGLPSWWELQFGLDPSNPDTGDTGISDGYKNPMGDGWSNLYKYEHALNPNVAYTPPPPRNVVARADATGTNVILSWQSGGGTVSSYEIRGRYFSEFDPIGSVNAATFTFTDSSLTYHLTDDWYGPPQYIIRAYFSSGGYADSAVVTPAKAALSTTDLHLLRGPDGKRYIALSSPPPELSRIVLSWVNGLTGELDYTNVYGTNLVNGLALAPTMDSYLEANFAYQLIATNGESGGLAFGDPYPYWFEGGSHLYDSFVDARRFMKENLYFLLRSATGTRPFSYTSDRTLSGTYPYIDPDFVSEPEFHYARPPSPTSYEYYGFHFFSYDRNHSILQELRPMREHYLWRNFVFDFDDYGFMGAGFLFDPAGPTAIRTLDNPLYDFTGPITAANPPPLAFSTTNSTWLYFRWVTNWPFDEDANFETGVSLNANTNLVLNSAARNCYGLPINSVNVNISDGPYLSTLQPGIPSTYHAGFAQEYYPETAIPRLKPEGYYFVSQTPHFRYDSARPPLPGSPDFTVSHASPLLLAPAGQPFTMLGWAKLALTNGYANKYAYLEQYFDKAYRIADNGITTTNETGLLLYWFSVNVPFGVEA
jgi:hypothetical protein